MTLAINTFSSAAPAPAAAQSTAAPMGAEYNSFLKLLTAQMKNQDPLAPLESTQFVEQLATFSALEQQVQSNASLERIAAMLTDFLAATAQPPVTHPDG